MVRIDRLPIINILLFQYFHHVPPCFASFVVLQFLLTLFGLLRKKAWNYGRLALLNKTDDRWMELFYGDNEGRDTDAICVENSVNSQLSHVDRGFLSWIDRYCIQSYVSAI